MRTRHLLILALLLFGIVAGGTVTAAQAQEWSYACQGAPAPRLTPGEQGRVTPGLPNVLRSQPGRSWYSQVIGQIPAGGVFTVLAGYAPQCADGMYWYLVSYNGLIGWTAEGSTYGEYWLEPIGDPTASCGVLAPRLVPGQLGRVTPGLPNVLRSQPGRGPNSRIVGQIPAGGVFTVLYGYAAQCAEGMLWWYVSYNGIAGWTPEGQGYTYWLEPYTGGTNPNCMDLPSRLWVGAWGVVTPGLPNTLRASPSTTSARIGSIPAGGLFRVLSGPYCAQGITWWEVNYNGVRGYTGEGRWGSYWLAPHS